MENSFDRLSDQSLQAWNFAEEEARRLGFDRLLPNHLLLGLLSLEGDLPAEVLAKFGIKFDDIRDLNEREFCLKKEIKGIIEATPSVKRVLAKADLEAIQFGESITPAHLLLGLISLEDVGTRVFGATCVEIELAIEGYLTAAAVQSHVVVH